MQILKLDIVHQAAYPWQYVEGKLCHLRLRTTEDVKKIAVWYGDPFWFSGTDKEPVLECCHMRLTQNILDDVLYSVTIPMRTHKLHYYFEIILEGNKTVFLSESGVTLPIADYKMLRFFNVPYVYTQEYMPAPEWANGFIWYQIFPDRFCDGQGNKESSKFVPTRSNYFGGTIEGITQKIQYLHELGVQGLYLNPIFGSDSNHRYDTISYDYIEPSLGSERAFKNLVEGLHKAGMKIMLDGVFNHCSWDNVFWQDVKRLGKQSQYYDWFLIYDEKSLREATLCELTSERMQQNPPYESFAFAANMPKWNTENTEVIDYLISRVERWTREFDIDAWRLDVPDEVNMHFLRKFSRRMREINPNIYIIGEIWQDASLWLEERVFHGVMDYPLYYAVRDYAMLQNDKLDTFSVRIQQWFESIPDDVHLRQWAFCSNHDIARAFSLCDSNREDYELAYLLIALLGGGISIYYGDEIAMEGGEDPDNRRAMQWYNPHPDVVSFFQKLLSIKKTYLKYARLVELQVAEYLRLRLESSEYDIVAIITDKGRSVRVPFHRGYKLLLDARDGQAVDGIVERFAVFCKKKTEETYDA